MQLPRLDSSHWNQITNSVKLSTLEKKYTNPAQTLEKAGKTILGEKYSVTLEAPSSSKGLPMRLCIVPHQKTNLSLEDITKNKNEIYYSFISKLEEELGGAQFKKLVTKCQGTGEKYYIDLSLDGLSDVEITEKLTSFFQNAEIINTLEVSVAKEKEVADQLVQSKVSISIPLLIEASYNILGDVYAVTCEERFFEYDPTNETHSGPRNSIMLKIRSTDGHVLNHTEIRLNLIQELRKQLGDRNFKFLVKDNGAAHGKARDGSYCIELNLTGLQKANLVLQKLLETTRLETKDGKLARENECKEAMRADERINIFMKKESNESLKRDFGAMYEIFTRFTEAYKSDENFQKIVEKELGTKQNFNPDKDFSDSDHRYKCFTIYLNTYRHHYCTLRQIFNSINPAMNKAKFVTYKTYCETIADEPGIDLATSTFYHALQGCLKACCEYLDSEEKKYDIPANNVIAANTFVVGRTHSQKSELRFEEFHIKEQTIGGEVEWVLVKVYGSKDRIIETINDFHRKVVCVLEERLGTERFKLLAPSYDPTVLDTCSGHDRSFFIMCDPVELAKIKLSDLIPFSAHDLEMYTQMLMDKKSAKEDIEKHKSIGIPAANAWLQKYQGLLRKGQDELAVCELQLGVNRGKLVELYRSAITEEQQPELQRLNEEILALEKAKETFDYDIKRFKLEIKNQKSVISRINDKIAELIFKEEILPVYELYVRFKLANLVPGSTIALGLDSDFSHEDFINYVMEFPHLINVVKQIFDTSVSSSKLYSLIQYCQHTSEILATTNPERSNWYLFLGEVVKCCFQIHLRNQ